MSEPGYAPEWQVWLVGLFVFVGLFGVPIALAVFG